MHATPCLRSFSSSTSLEGMRTKGGKTVEADLREEIEARIQQPSYLDVRPAADYTLSDQNGDQVGPSATIATVFMLLSMLFFP